MYHITIMLRVYSYVVINRRAQMSPRAYIYRLTFIACCGSRPPRPSVAARIYMYVTARSCVCDVICCVLVLARSIHKSPRARVHVYSCVAIAIFRCVAITRWRCVAIALFSLHCVAITLRRCVAIAMFLFVVSKSLVGVVS